MNSKYLILLMRISGKHFPLCFIFTILSFTINAFGQNLLTNGGFEAGFTHWTNYTHGGSEANFSLENSDVAEGTNAMKVDITTPGSNPWDVQSIHSGWAPLEGNEYMLTLKAKAAVDGSNFKIIQQNQTYAEKTITLTESYNEYTWNFTARENDLQLKFHFPNAGVFYIDDVSITGNAGLQVPPEPSGRRLRTIMTDKYADGRIIVGGTTGAWAFGTKTGYIMDREFNYVTPENDFKQWNIHPDPDTWNWVQTDAWVQHIEENDQILRMHAPIGIQCSDWAQTGSFTQTSRMILMRY